MTSHFLPYWTALPFGIIIASIVTMFGIGGGIFWSPLLVFGYGLSIPEAILTSLFIQIAGIGSGAVKYYKNNLVDTGTAFIMILFAIPGVIVGSILSKNITLKNFELLLGIITFSISVIFVISKEEYKSGVERAEKKDIWKISFAPLFLSIISGLLSVGIGDFLVPLFKSVLKLKMKNAVATAIFIMAFVVAIGSFSHLAIGSKVKYNLIMFAIPGVIIGGQLGPGLTKYINDQRLKELFIFLLALIGMHTIVNAI